MSPLSSSLNRIQQEAQQKLLEEAAIGESSKQIPNPGISILFFLVITTVLLILKIVLLPSEKLDDFNNENPMTNIIFIVYILLLFSGNYLINTSITAQICGGTPQWGTTFISTFLPWILIFGIINIILVIFPGWLIPFSNTFGYFVVTLFGLKDLFNQHIIESKNKFGNVDTSSIGNNDNNDNMNVSRALQQIYGNESLLINEIPRASDLEGAEPKTPVEIFVDFFNTMQKLKIFRDKPIEDIDKAKVELYRLLKIKDYVAEYIWYILAGILVSSISYNYIVNIGCDMNSQQMASQYNNFVKDKLDNNNESDSKKIQDYKDIINS
jgi:hypothetical protein